MTVLLAVDYLEEHWQFYYFIADLYTVYGEMFAPVLFSHTFRPELAVGEFLLFMVLENNRIVSEQI